MKVTIDTKEDTHEDIRKVLHILTEILERRSAGFGSAGSQYSQGEATDTANLMSMFDTSGSATARSPADSRETAPDFSSFLELAGQKKGELSEEERKEPEIEVY